MFGQVAASPFGELRGGLVLGRERLWQKALQCLRTSPGQEELRFRQPADRQTVSRWIAAACEREADRRIQIWLRVELGGKRQTDVAAAYGYRDGSGVHRVVQRLEGKGRTDSTLQARLDAWRAELSSVNS